MSKYVSVDAVKAALTGWQTEPTDDDIAFALEQIPPANVEPVVNAKWVYYTNEEGRARWKCSVCGKICRKPPRDKKRCSNCGAHIEMGR